jgi:hypothetical protein
MQALQKIEEDVRRLSRSEQESLRDWLDNILEDELELSDEFKAKIERGEADIREGQFVFASHSYHERRGDRAVVGSD